MISQLVKFSRRIEHKFPIYASYVHNSCIFFFCLYSFFQVSNYHTVSWFVDLQSCQCRKIIEIFELKNLEILHTIVDSVVCNITYHFCKIH